MNNLLFSFKTVTDFLMDNILYTVIGVLVIMIIILLIAGSKKTIKIKQQVEIVDTISSTETITEEVKLDSTSEETPIIEESSPVIEEQTSEPIEETVAVSENSKPISSEETQEEEKTTTMPKPIAKNNVLDEKTPAKETTKKVKKSAEKEAVKTGYNGKWIITMIDDDAYVATLYASNGELLLTSEEYTSYNGAKGGIETIKQNVKEDHYIIREDKNKNYYFKVYFLMGTTKRMICVSETYQSEFTCEHAFLSVKKFAESAILVKEKTDDTEE